MQVTWQANGTPEHTIDVVPDRENSARELQFRYIIDNNPADSGVECTAEKALQVAKARLARTYNLSGRQLLCEARAQYPTSRFALHREQHILGIWNGTRWQAVAMKSISGQWLAVDFEVRVNGVLPYTDTDFDESF